MYGMLQDIVQAQQTSQDRQEQQQAGQTEHLDEELVLFFFRELGVSGVGRHNQAAAGGRRAEAVGTMVGHTTPIAELNHERMPAEKP